MICSVARGAEIAKQWPADEFARHPLHDFNLARVYAAQETSHVSVLLRADNDFWFAPFQVRNGIATCLAQGRPMICSRGFRSSAELREALICTSQALDALLYFPLVEVAYLEAADNSWLDARAGMATWPRLPSPTICGLSARAGLLDRARLRLGVRAERRLRRFRDAEPTVRTATGLQAINALQQVESTSWKAERAQDIWSRGQGDFYVALVTSEHALVRVASVGDRPIAYRFDYRRGNEVYVMKWSFSESARSMSPGFYMLVVDLSETYAKEDVDHIDLYGSPDTLKAAIRDEGSDRLRKDIAFPGNHVQVEGLRSDRSMHDARIATAFANGQSIRSLYA